MLIVQARSGRAAPPDRQERRPRRLRHRREGPQRASQASASTRVTGEIVDMVKAGIVDPAKVTRSTVQNAASIAGLVLTTETLVVEKPEPKKSAAGGAPRHGRHGRHGLLS